MRDKNSHQRSEAGFTIPAFARHYGLPIGKVRRAVKRKEIKTVGFAGLERITPAEAKRVAELFGWGPVDDSGK
jgi:hypothetical protein